MLPFIKKGGALLLSLFALGFLLHIAKATGFNFIVNLDQLPDLSSVVARFEREITNPTFLQDGGISLLRVYAGFFLATLLAIPLALAVATIPLFELCVYPLVELIRPIPNAAWVPFSILMFSSLEGSVIFITFIGAFFPIFVNALDGVRRAAATYRVIATSLGTTRRAYLLEILFPGALPQIFTGLSLGMGGAWLGLVVAEITSGRSGLGYYIWDNYTLLDTTAVAVGMAVVGVLGAVSTAWLRAAAGGLHRWTRI